MKKHILPLVLALVTCSTSLLAQVDIVPFAGYNFGAKVPIYGGEIKLKGAATYGAMLDYFIDDETSVQFSYAFSATNSIIRDYYGTGNGTFQPFGDLNTNYFLLSGVRYFGTDVIQPYASFGMGMAYYNFTEWDDEYQQYNNKNDYYRFAIGFGLGAKIMMSERVGLAIHCRALAPIQWGGIGIGVGTGGVSTGAYAGSSFISGDVGGGLVFRLGN